MSDNPSPFTEEEKYILEGNIAIVGDVVRDTVKDWNTVLRAQTAAIVATLPDQKQPHGAHKSPKPSPKQWEDREAARKRGAFERGELTEEIANNLIDGLTPEAEENVAAARGRMGALVEGMEKKAPEREARLIEAINGINTVFERHGIPKVDIEASPAENKNPSSNPGKSPAVAPGSRNL